MTTATHTVPERTRPAEQTPHPTTLDEVRPLATIAVFSTSEPNAAGLLGMSRWTAYAEAKSGRLPTLRSGSRRARVLVPALRRMLGDLAPLPESTETPAAGR
ncbi:MAG: hypothetical protein WKF50_13920 [Nocardioides sp.]